VNLKNVKNLEGDRKSKKISGLLLNPWLCLRYRNRSLLFKQNSDEGVGFMALARLAHDKARKAGIGTDI